MNLLSKDPQTGGEWLITDMARSQSVFELFPKTLNELKQNLEYEGSDLAGINAEFAFKEIPKVSTANILNCQLEMMQHYFFFNFHFHFY